MGVIPTQNVDLFTITIEVDGKSSVKGVETSRQKAEEKAQRLIFETRKAKGQEASVSHTIDEFKVDVGK